MNRPSVTVVIEDNHAGGPLQSMIAALLLPLAKSCDVYIRTEIRTHPEAQPAPETPRETETDHG